MAAAANLRPATPGNQLARRHGAYARLQLGERATDLADDLRKLLPSYSPSDEPVIQAYAALLAQVERASVALSIEQAHEMGRIREGKRPTPASAKNLQRLSQDLKGWLNTALKYAVELGLTPRSRSALGLDLLRAEESVQSLIDRGRTIRETHEARA